MALSIRRFLIASGLLVGSLLLAILLLAWWQQRGLSDAQQAADFARARAVQQLVESQAREDLVRRSELVADDPAFASYVEMAIGGALPGVEVDTTSLVDLLRERQQRLGFALTAVLDQNGRVLGTTSALLPTGHREQGDVFRNARDRDTTVTGVWAAPKGLFHVAVVPLSAVGLSDGFLMTAVPLGPAYVDAISHAGVDAALVATGRVDASPRGSSGAAEADRRDALMQPVFGSRLALIALRAREAPGRARAWLPWVLAALLVGGMAAFVAAWTWRRLLVPASLITDRLERAHAGDLHLQVTPAAAGELAPLAAAFNRFVVRVREWSAESAR